MNLLIVYLNRLIGQRPYIIEVNYIKQNNSPEGYNKIHFPKGNHFSPSNDPPKHSSAPIPTRCRPSSPMSLIERLNNVKMFLPVSTWLITWYTFVIFFMLTDLVLTVIVNCYDHGPSRVVLFQAINYLLPVILISDIAISFNVGIIKNGKIILNRRAANREYVMTIYFYCDIITLVMSFLQIIFQNTFMKDVNIFHYIIFIKLTTAYFLDSLIKKYVIKSFNALLFYEVCKNFVILAVISHLIGSFYFYIDVLMYQNNWYGTNQLWIFNSYAYSNIYTSDFWIQYTYSYYVACVTLSGTAYGDIIPLNPHENLYIFCCFIFPMLIYSYVYASIFQALFNRRSTTAQIRRYKFLAKEYLKSLGVTEKVMTKILTFMEFTHRKNMIVDTKFIEDLAPTVKSKYLTKILDGKFQYNCFDQILHVAQLDSDYLRHHLMNVVRQEYFPERFSLLDAEKLKIYYINTGKVVEVVKLSDSKKLSKPIEKFNHVAKTAFFTNQIPTQRFSYESNSFVMAHSVDYKEFKNIIKTKMPTLNEAFCYIQMRIIDAKDYELMDEKCFFCDANSHILKDCPHLNFDRKVFERNRTNEYQQRLKFNRDQVHKQSLAKRPNLQKKQKLFRKLSNTSYEIDFTQNKRSKKVYQSGKTSILRNVVHYAHDRFLSKGRKNFLQQTLEEDFTELKLQTNYGTSTMQIEKVCIWDRFYPEMNINAQKMAQITGKSFYHP